MEAPRLYCPACGYELPPGSYRHRCPRCGRPLEILGSFEWPRLLGEGETPVVEYTRGGSRVAFKLEYLNPTGSFKDRGAAASLYHARLLGYECVVEDSSGNAGLAVAAYAARLGLRARIHTYRGAGRGKKALIRSLGAVLVEWPTRADAARAAEAEAGECYYVAHSWSPIFIEGVSTIAGELGAYRDWDFIVPASSGTLLLGLWRGALRRGWRPRLIVVQAAEAASLLGRVRLLARAGGPTSRLADALVLRDPPRLDEMARAVRESGGGLVVVGDEAIREALRDLLSMGFIVEPTSAAAWAAFKALQGEGYARDSVVVLTGSGLKYAEVLEVEAGEHR
ncbi:MAG: pyridoxal-phosphate dependent enzyme [Desulfurococcales archaeon]|nr:pyridoxal-phosphate dependent enzyme [Desulfurococcales archaeon]